jgi:DNA-binding transcriptional MerR regulator
MKTAEVVKQTGIPSHKLYYLEIKGYIAPRRTPMGQIEARDYSQEEILKIQRIWKYLKSGYKHKVAYQKAMKKRNRAKVR